MTDGVSTVATQTMQLWLTEDEQTLGWSERDVTVSGYPGAFHTYAAMSELIDAESWPVDERPAALGLLLPRAATGPTPPPGDVVLSRPASYARVARRRDRVPPPTTCATSGRTPVRTATSAGTCSPGPRRPRVQPASTTSTSGPTSIRRTATCSRCRAPAGYRLRADESGYDNLVARRRLDRLRLQRRLHRGRGRVGHPGRQRGARSPAARRGRRLLPDPRRRSCRPRRSEPSATGDVARP